MTLILSLICTTFLVALGSALVLTSIAETQIAASYDRAIEALHAADGAAERALADLSAIADWSDVLDGSVQSAFVDGAPGGTRVLADGVVLDLTRTTNRVRCGRDGCTSADLDASTAERPWGANNPRWQLFAYGPLQALLPPGSIRSQMYVVVWAGDDADEQDGRPLVDGDPNADGSANAGRDVLVLLAHAYGPAGVRRMVEMTIARGTGGPRLLAWREIRQ